MAEDDELWAMVAELRDALKEGELIQWDRYEALETTRDRLSMLRGAYWGLADLEQRLPRSHKVRKAAVKPIRRAALQAMIEREWIDAAAYYELEPKKRPEQVWAMAGAILGLAEQREHERQVAEAREALGLPAGDPGNGQVPADTGRGVG